MHFLELLRSDLFGSLAYFLFQTAAFVCFCFFLYAWVRHEYRATVHLGSKKKGQKPESESG
jgi:Gpi18-like mannosyltransferase